MKVRVIYFCTGLDKHHLFVLGLRWSCLGEKVDGLKWVLVIGIGILSDILYCTAYVKFLSKVAANLFEYLTTSIKTAKKEF